MMSMDDDPFENPTAVSGATLSAGPRLSTDYLNRYAEVAMLLTLGADDPSIMDILQDWKPLTYCEHFRISGLRDADDYIAGYTNLPDDMRKDFDEITKNLNRLSQISILAMTSAEDAEMRAQLADISVTSLNHHISRLTAFLNADGANELHKADDSIQDAVDDMMAITG